MVVLSIPSTLLCFHKLLTLMDIISYLVTLFVKATYKNVYIFVLRINEKFLKKVGKGNEITISNYETGIE